MNSSLTLLTILLASRTERRTTKTRILAPTNLIYKESEHIMSEQVLAIEHINSGGLQSSNWTVL